MYQLQYFTFPQEFKLGVADADLQVIGEKHTLNAEGSEPTMWTHFAKNSGGVYKNQTPLNGIDRYHRWKEDVHIMKALGVKHYRTSISMARIMTKDRKPNKKALEWYKTFFSYLQKNGITIYATLYHWELPQFLSAQGGWKNRETTEYLVEHAKIAHIHLGDFIEEYFIINEPYQIAFESYHLGAHAPGEKDLKGALAAVHHILLAQGMVYNLLRSMDKKVKLSTVCNPTITYAHTSSADDRKAAQYALGYQTTMFTDPIYLGKYPKHMVDLFADKMPPIKSGDMELIKVGDGLESFGVNYYQAKNIQYDSDSEVKFARLRYPQEIVNGLDWPVSLPPTYSDALYDLLCLLYNRYNSYGMKQLYVTENGTPWNDTVNSKGAVDDEFRIFYLREHLRLIQKAILAGVPVKGFFLWTFMDNYEWDYGYQPGSNFGIVHIDRESFARTPKKSYYWYQQVIKNKALS